MLPASPRSISSRRLRLGSRAVCRRSKQREMVWMTSSIDVGLTKVGINVGVDQAHGAVYIRVTGQDNYHSIGINDLEAGSHQQPVAFPRDVKVGQQYLKFARCDQPLRLLCGACDGHLKALLL